LDCTTPLGPCKGRLTSFCYDDDDDDDDTMSIDAFQQLVSWGRAPVKNDALLLLGASTGRDGFQYSASRQRIRTEMCGKK